PAMCLAASDRDVHLRSSRRARLNAHRRGVRRSRSLHRAPCGARSDGTHGQRLGAHCRGGRADRDVPRRSARMNIAPHEAEWLLDRVEELERLIGMRPVLPRLLGLPPREADVFGILLKRQVMSAEQLFEAIWG